MDPKQRQARQSDGEVAVESFVALSPGIGLGEPRTPPARGTPSPAHIPSALTPPMTSSAVQPAISVSTLNSAPATGWHKGAAAFPPASSPQSSAALGRSASRRGMPVGRQLLAYSLDFMLVCLTLGTAVACAAVWQSVQNDLDLSTEWYALPPWQWLSRFPIFEILAAVYAVFFVYLIMFKWAVGFTLGESLMRPSAKRRGHRPARAKRS